MDITKKFFAELLGTFWLVFAGLGSAFYAASTVADTNAGIPDVGIGWLGVSLAFGLTVITMAYGIGHISGAHLNPAVTLGAFAGGRIHVKDVIPYILAQCAGAIGAAFLLWFIATGKADFAPGLVADGFASNGYGDNSPQEIQHGFGHRRRSRYDVCIRYGDPWCYRLARSCRIGRSSNRTLFDPDPLGHNSDFEL